MPECVGFSEIDKHAEAIYRYHWPEHRNYGDATAIDPAELPDFDFLIGGFPCQSFSIAGKRRGFDEARGTLFFEIARILSHKRPAHFLLENVKGLSSHDDGRTIIRIHSILSGLGYRVERVLLNSKDYGVPQNRERVFFIGHLAERCQREILSVGNGDGEVIQPGYVEPISGTISTKNQSGQCQFDGSTTLIVKKDGTQQERDYAACLTGGGHSGGNHSDMDLIQVIETKGNADAERVYSSEGLARTLKGEAGGGGAKMGLYAIHDFNVNRNGGSMTTRTHTDGVVRALKASQSGTSTPMAELESRKIRRLTPIECERLQGCEDGHTKFGRYVERPTRADLLWREQNPDLWAYQSKRVEGEDVTIREVSDTQRYKGLGNAFTVNVIESLITAMLEKGCLRKRNEKNSEDPTNPPDRGDDSESVWGESEAVRVI